MYHPSALLRRAAHHLEVHRLRLHRHAGVAPGEAHLGGLAEVLLQVGDGDLRLGAHHRALHVGQPLQQLVGGAVQVGLRHALVDPLLGHVHHHIFIIGTRGEALVVGVGHVLRGAHLWERAALLPRRAADGRAVLVGLHAVDVGHAAVQVLAARGEGLPGEHGLAVKLPILCHQAAGLRSIGKDVGQLVGRLAEPVVVAVGVLQHVGGPHLEVQPCELLVLGGDFYLVFRLVALALQALLLHGVLLGLAAGGGDGIGEGEVVESLVPAVVGELRGDVALGQRRRGERDLVHGRALVLVAGDVHRLVVVVGGGVAQVGALQVHRIVATGHAVVLVVVEVVFE